MFLAMILAELICNFSETIEKAKDFYMNHAAFSDILVTVMIAAIVICEVLFYTYCTVHLSKDFKTFLKSIKEEINEE